MDWLIWLVFGLGWFLVLPILGIIYLVHRHSEHGKDDFHTERPSSGREIIAAEELEIFEKDAQWAKYKPAIVRLRKALYQMAGVSPTSPAGNVKPVAESQIPTREKVKFNWYAPENINVLLYLGAFLLLVSLGTFIAYNWQDFSGLQKMGFASFFSFFFYGLGLYLYKAKPIFKPAGLTFYLIGLISMPLLGVAYYVFMAEGVGGSEIWLWTSVVVLLAYMFSLFVVRKSYVAAATSLALASLMSSSIYSITGALDHSIIILPLSSTLMYMASYFLKGEQEIYDGIRPTAIGIAIFSSALALFSQDIELVLGSNLIVASSFYLFAYFYETEQRLRTNLFTLATALLPLATWLMLRAYDVSTDWQIDSLAIFAFVYAGGAYLFDNREEGRILSVIAPIVSVFPFLQSGSRHPHQMLTSFAGTIVAISLYLKRKQGWMLLFAIPFSGFFFYLLHDMQFFPNAASHFAGYTFFLLFICWYLFGYVNKTISDARGISYAGAALYALLALAFAASSTTTLFFVSLLLTVSAAGIAELERQPSIHILTVILSFIPLFTALEYTDTNERNWGYFMMGLSSVWYVIGLAVREWSPERGKALRYSALVAQFFSGFTTPGYREGVSILSFYVLSGLLAIEAVIDRIGGVGYAASAVFMIALERHLFFLGFEETQVFTVPLAVYFAVLALLRAKRGDSKLKDLFTVLSLFMLTVPLFMQSTASDGQLYALVLGIEAILLVVAGISLAYRLVTTWAVAMLVLDVLWQAKDFLFALPQWVIYLFVGLALLGGAMYLLKKRAEHER